MSYSNLTGICDELFTLRDEMRRVKDYMTTLKRQYDAVERRIVKFLEGYNGSLEYKQHTLSIKKAHKPRPRIKKKERVELLRKLVSQRTDPEQILNKLKGEPSKEEYHRLCIQRK